MLDFKKMRGACVRFAVGIGGSAADVRDNARYCAAVREQQMVHRLRSVAVVGETRCVMTIAVAQIRGAPGFVERGPGIDLACEFAAHQVGVIGEAIRDVAIEPAAAIFQILRQIPVIERDKGLEPLLFQPPDDPLVKVDALLIRAPCFVHHARPCNGKTVCIDVKRAEQIEVRFPPMIVIAGDLAGVACQHFAGHGRERVPDRREAAIFVRGAFDLVGSGCGAEQKVSSPEG